ncbi:MAG: Smr/MutS family protein [Brumimicrobium sp.]
MRFNIGEKVGFLNEVGEGIVLSYKSPFIVVVEDETGFNYEMKEDELVKIHGDQTGVVEEYEKEEAKIEILDSFGQSALNGLTKNKDFWEVDLHSHFILESERGLSSYQILTQQLYVFKRCFREAQSSKIRKMIVIHGVGEGVLKSEVRNFLEGRAGIEFYDADFREYGKGATEIRIYYKNQ